MIQFEEVKRIKEQNIQSKIPERSTKNAAGYDFFSVEEVKIQPNEIKYVKTGIKAKQRRLREKQELKKEMEEMEL